MNYAILRTKKLKSFGAIARSARHTFREQPTPNANAALSKLNRGSGAKSAVALIEALKKRLPEKYRAQSVLCIEYLITASPEAFARHGGVLDEMGSGYFSDALKWLRELHGKENVVATAVHLDERTPHLVAYVVPRTRDGRLSCRDFLGGPAKLKAMQTDFHKACGKPHGLQRGIEGSKAKHQELKSFYGALLASGMAPKLNAGDYAAAALGIKTASWRRAEAVAKSNAEAAAVAPTIKKALASRGRSLRDETEKLSQRLQIVEHKKLLLKHLESDFEARADALLEREKAISAAEHKIKTVEADREALERRLAILTERMTYTQKTPRRGLDHDRAFDLS